ncbi:MAG: carboxypeptidase-like regulatory domain-containing protein [Methanomicrobiales archaeon]|nr:carboxypeptidase-like regulatory domain-containing protein [Methanomicrobiales archaeon]
MERARSILLLPLLISFSCAVQAATLNITVLDDADNTPLRDVAISVNGDYVGKTGTDGTYRYSHALNDSFYLKASKVGYDDWINLVSHTETSLTVEMTRKSEVITIVAYDRETLQPLVNAFVKVTGENLSATAQTDEQGEAQFTLKTGGIYTIEIRSTRYEPVIKSVDLSAGERTLQYWLYRNDIFILSVFDASTQQPIENATVTINTVVEGTTGPDGRLPLAIERERKYRIVVTKPDYETAVLEKYLTGEDLLLEISLSKSVYPVSFAVFDEERRPVEGATVFIDTVPKGKTDAFGRIGIATLAAGSYVIEVKGEGFELWRETKNISGHSEEVIVELIFAATNVTIRVLDSEEKSIEGAALQIDGKQDGITNAQGEVSTSLKTGLVHNISASLDGYRPSSLTKDLPLGSPATTITLTMERELDTGLIFMSLVGIVVIIGVLLAIRTFYLERRTRRPRRH